MTSSEGPHQPSAAATSGAASTEYVVRLATPADAAVIVEFNKAIAMETENLTLQDELIRKGIDAVVNPDGEGARSGARYYVLEAPGGDVIAQLMLTMEWSDWRNNMLWWIQSVYTRPDARGAGHFKRLYAHVRQEAQRAGAGGLRLYTDDNNVSAQAAYKRLGMTSHYRVYEDLFTES